MLINNAYYALKPFMPWPVRLALRRLRAGYKRRVWRSVWPIDEKAGTPPPDWPGWPGGKQFAIVLTHDVEGAKGMNRVESLAGRELQHGFRSAFNFVPEGEYRLSEDLREKLERGGFEVGVHGLEHDGKLYRSKAAFAAKAVSIREYLRRWNACGFRSPLMQHRLGWLHQLGLEYDCSTFDTDPFEPESDGVRTIFPFWVANPNGAGYVELPYTLVQDFTLFVVLREQNIDIWKKKLEWIASRGGMALLNTHPDYMTFGDKQTRDEFPVSYYEAFLKHVQDTYAGTYWNALPREVARYYCARLPRASRNSRKRICMVAYTHYETDNRVRRYAEALAKRGDHVDVIALGTGTAPLRTENLAGVTLFRVQRRENDERHKWTYAWRLIRFLFVSSLFLARRHNFLRYDLIHAHNVPDFLTFAAWYPKLNNAKVILDIHDIVPELFANKFGTTLDSSYVGVLKAIEKASAAFADHVIVSNHLWHEKLMTRSVASDKCSVFVNHVDPAIFYRRTRTRADDRLIILFPGSFQHHQGLDVAIEALAHLKGVLPQAELHLYGGGGGAAMESRLNAFVERCGVQDRVKFFGSVPLDQVPEVMANADIGIVPKRADSFGDEAYSTKIMEFMSQGVPVVVSKTKVDTFYFDDQLVRFFTPGDSKALARAIVEVVQDEGLRSNLVIAGLKYARQNSWEENKQAYFKLVDSLTVERFGIDIVPQSRASAHV